jgi:hypothetical protein
MSTQATAAAGHEPQSDHRLQRPYEGYPLSDLYEILERDYGQGRPFNEHIVWELIHRAAKIEELQTS